MHFAGHIETTSYKKNLNNKIALLRCWFRYATRNNRSWPLNQQIDNLFAKENLLEIGGV
jgi:hypothetical protein